MNYSVIWVWFIEIDDYWWITRLLLRIHLVCTYCITLYSYMIIARRASRFASRGRVGIEPWVIINYTLECQINILVRLILLLPPRLLGTFYIIENLAYNAIELNKWNYNIVRFLKMCEITKDKKEDVWENV